MRKEIDLGDGPRVGSRSATRSRRLDDLESPNSFAAPEEFDDEYFNVPEPSGSRRISIPPTERAEAAPRRTRTTRQMPKRLSEELSEQVEADAFEEEVDEPVKKPRARRRYTKQEAG